MSGRNVITRNGSGVRVVERVHSTTSMISDALAIVDEQLLKLRLRSNSENFEESDVKTLHTLIKSLVDLSKEEREREKAEKDLGDLSKLTNEELLDLATKRLSQAKESIK